MFRKSKLKIVVSIMIIMTILIAGTIGVIYISSYREMAGKNERMLEHYIKIHNIEHSNSGVRGDETGSPPPKPEDERAYELATIYSVSFDSDNNVTGIDNTRKTATNDELERMAKSILASDGTAGKINGYSYLVNRTEHNTLVAFMDNSDLDKSIKTLLKYTLIFGGVALTIVLLISIFLAKKIISPLEKNHAMQKRFISDAGHELKTPVTVISTNAQVLAEEIGGSKWLDNIIYENEKMAVLIKQLMELTRTENSEACMEKVDFSRIVLGEILPFESIAFEKNIEMEYENIEEGINVSGNASQLAQMVAIFVDNAIEHSTGGNIQVVLEKNHGKAILSVSNNGEAIPKEQQEQLFDRFYRLDASRNSDSNHYGLGLSIAKSIIDAHKGEIEINCVDGKIIFSVSLREIK